MVLEIDIGNSWLKWRLVDGVVQVASGREPTQALAAAWLSGLGARYPVSRVLVACVAGEVRAQAVLAIVSELLPSADIGLARPVSECCGVRFAYHDAATLGIDRALAMVAAFQRRLDAVMVVDAGSAITVDLVGISGEHIGGYILPGMPLLRNVLAHGTAQLPAVQQMGADSMPGRSTIACIEAGLSLLVEGLVARLERLAREQMIEAVFFTGGDGGALHRIYGGASLHCPDLVFEGLEFMFGVLPPVRQAEVGENK
jgi:type III pantothenate kinase